MIGAPLLSAAAEPLDLCDPTPRAVDVQLGVDRDDDQADGELRFTEWLSAWLEPTSAPGRVRVRVPGDSVERYALAGTNPEPGSFSEFVWELECGSGEVVTATLTGRMRRDLDFRLWSTKVRIHFEVRLSTMAAGGFEPVRRRFGEMLHAFCDDAASNSCTLVAPLPYDAESGEVRAVGVLSARGLGLTTSTFAPLGAARFAEHRPGAITTGVSIGPREPSERERTRRASSPPETLGRSPLGVAPGGPLVPPKSLPDRSLPDEEALGILP